MNVTIDLPAETEKELRDLAARSGKDVPGFIQLLIERVVRAPSGAEKPPATGNSLDELLAPVRAEFERSGMTDEELASLVEEVRQEIWQERQGRNGS